ncbi:hypothetical protein TVAG_075770 [Trichomonas vaginalis G3]|uniref:Uncharacterized protein n=1 Tax=Trichomonas vaginalis (strain ATCC PRA-98 / G3) TaxID=412133 RepID=A2D9H4_TRIV3|nr:hypothetical protein TVAG_075770 [Trichomonas vaginalis G3]|eukprot:XP_001583816.1 hypothetical protein [Trichomonas vaginalis G3]
MLLSIFFYLAYSDGKICFRENENAKACSQDADVANSIDDLKSKIQSSSGTIQVELGLNSDTIFQYDMNQAPAESKINFNGLNVDSKIYLTNVNNLQYLHIADLTATLSNSNPFNIGEIYLDCTLSLSTPSPKLIATTMSLTSSMLKYFSSIRATKSLIFLTANNIEKNYALDIVNPISFEFSGIYSAATVDIAGDLVIVKYPNGNSISIPFISNENNRPQGTFVFRDLANVNIQKIFQDYQQSSITLHSFKQLDLNIMDYDYIPSVVVFSYDNSLLNILGFSPDYIYLRTATVKAIEPNEINSFIIVLDNGHPKFNSPVNTNYLNFYRGSGLESDFTITTKTLQTSTIGPITIDAELIVNDGTFSVKSECTVKKYNEESTGLIVICYNDGFIPPLTINDLGFAKVAYFSSNRVDLIKEMDYNITNNLNTMIPLLKYPSKDKIVLEGYNSENYDGFSGSTCSLELQDGIIYLKYTESPLSFRPTFCIGNSLENSDCKDDPTRFFLPSQSWKNMVRPITSSITFSIKSDTSLDFSNAPKISELSISTNNQVTITTSSVNLNKLTLNQGTYSINCLGTTRIATFVANYATVQLHNAQSVNISDSMTLTATEITHSGGKMSLTTKTVTIYTDCKLPDFNLDNTSSLYVHIGSIDAWSPLPEFTCIVGDSRLTKLVLKSGSILLETPTQNHVFQVEGNKTLTVQYPGFDSTIPINISCEATDDKFPVLQVMSRQYYNFYGKWPTTTKSHVLDITGNPVFVNCDTPYFPLGFKYPFNEKNITITSSSDVRVTYQFTLEHYDFFPNIVMKNPFRFIINDHICKFGGGLKANHGLFVKKSEIWGNYEFEFNSISFESVEIEGNNSVYMYDMNISQGSYLKLVVGWAQEPMKVIAHGVCDPSNVTVKVEDGARSPRVYHNVFCCDTMKLNEKNLISKGSIKELKIQNNCIVLKHNARSEDALPHILIAAIVIASLSVMVSAAFVIWLYIRYRKVKETKVQRKKKNDLREYRVEEVQQMEKEIHDEDQRP